MVDLVTIFCEIDDFCKQYYSKTKFLPLSKGKKKKNRSLKLEISEVMTTSYHFLI